MSTEPGLTDSAAYAHVFEYVGDWTKRGPTTRLRAAAELRAAADEYIAREIHDLRAPQHPSFTWQQIADALGVSKQAAQKRYGR